MLCAVIMFVVQDVPAQRGLLSPLPTTLVMDSSPSRTIRRNKAFFKLPWLWCFIPGSDTKLLQIAQKEIISTTAQFASLGAGRHCLDFSTCVVWISSWYMPQMRCILNIWNFYRCFSDEWMNPWVQLLPWVVCGTHVLSPLINLPSMSHLLSGTVSSPGRVLERGPLVGVWWEKLLSVLFIRCSLCWKAFPLGTLR